MSMLHELFEDAEPLNERPYSRTQSAIDSAKGGVKGMFGSGQVEQGAREAGDVANRLWVDFKRMIGRKYGKAQSSVPFADVEAFFKTNQLDTKGLGSNANRTFTPKDVGNALLAAAREQVTAEYRQSPPEQAPNAPQAAPAQAQSDSESVPVPPQSNPAGQAVDGLEAKIASLSKAERDQLLAMLG